jgi:hypothetical protein
MCKTLLAGTLRKTLVSTVATISGSTGLGVYPVDGYSRFVGILSTIGSMTLRWQMQAFSGTSLVSSSTTINSGSSLLDVRNYGKFVDLSVTAANSQVATVLILGDPSR